MKKNQFGKEIRRIRKTKKLTLAQLAKKVRITVPYLSMIERGLRMPSGKVTLRLMTYR